MDTSIVQDFERLLNTCYDSLRSDGAVVDTGAHVGDATIATSNTGEHQSRTVSHTNRTHGYSTSDAAVSSSRLMSHVQPAMIHPQQQQHPATLKRRRYRKRRTRRFLNIATTNPDSDEQFTQGSTNLLNTSPLVSEINVNRNNRDLKKSSIDEEDDLLSSADYLNKNNVKRKRRKHKSHVDSSVEMKDLSISLKSNQHNQMDIDFSSQSSSFSSSNETSDYNTPKARDGDDELSDSNTARSGCSPDAVTAEFAPWWEHDDDDDGAHYRRKDVMSSATSPTRGEEDSRFKDIVDKVFQQLPQRSKDEYRSTLDMLQSCHKYRMSAYKKNNKNNDSCDHQTQESFSVKRRKRQIGASTSSAGSNASGLVGQGATPVAEDNVGFQMMKSMGWDETKGLGSREDGIKTPILAFLKKGRKGLGNDEGKKVKPTN